MPSILHHLLGNWLPFGDHELNAVDASSIPAMRKVMAKLSEHGFSIRKAASIQLARSTDESYSIPPHVVEFIDAKGVIIRLNFSSETTSTSLDFVLKSARAEYHSLGYEPVCANKGDAILMAGWIYDNYRQFLGWFGSVKVYYKNGPQPSPYVFNPR